MSNSSAICTSFKAEILQAYHNFGTTVTRAGPGADTIQAALYLTTASIGAATTTYSATGEVTGTNYTAGGVPVPNTVAPTTSGTTAYWTPSGSIVYPSVTLSTAFDTVLLYNSTQGNRAILSYNFGSTTVTAGNLTLTMPSNTASTALLQFN